MTYNSNIKRIETNTVVAGMISSLFAFGATTLPVGMLEGTGGYSTGDYAFTKWGYKLPKLDNPSSNSTRPSGLTPEQNLQHLKAVLNPTVTELANALNVSRQSIYEWQSGARITSGNFEKLIQLALAADEFAKMEQQAIHHLIRRKIAGHNFFARVQAGESAIDVAKKLIEIANVEMQQRATVSEELKGRSKLDDIVEVPGPHYLSENG